MNRCAYIAPEAPVMAVTMSIESYDNRPNRGRRRGDGLTEFSTSVIGCATGNAMPRLELLRKVRQRSARSRIHVVYRDGIVGLSRAVPHVQRLDQAGVVNLRLRDPGPRNLDRSARIVTNEDHL